MTFSIAIYRLQTSKTVSKTMSKVLNAELTLKLTTHAFDWGLSRKRERGWGKYGVDLKKAYLRVSHQNSFYDISPTHFHFYQNMAVLIIVKDAKHTSRFKELCKFMPKNTLHICVSPDDQKPIADVDQFQIIITTKDRAKKTLQENPKIYIQHVLVCGSRNIKKTRQLVATLPYGGMSMGRNPLYVWPCRT